MWTKNKWMNWNFFVNWINAGKTYENHMETIKSFFFFISKNANINQANIKQFFINVIFDNK